tara:strand:- start:569 stop:793 length:225 start_codon:yes stop_codon:yes gene_type:complete
MMVELSLITLLETMSVDFCKYKSEGEDTYKALLISYSNASEIYGIGTVKKTIQESYDLKKTAALMAKKRCPEVF